VVIFTFELFQNSALDAAAPHQLREWTRIMGKVIVWGMEGLEETRKAEGKTDGKRGRELISDTARR